MLKCQEEEKNKFSDCEDASDMDSNEEGEDESSDTLLRNSLDGQEDEDEDDFDVEKNAGGQQRYQYCTAYHGKNDIRRDRKKNDYLLFTGSKSRDRMVAKLYNQCCHLSSSSRKGLKDLIEHALQQMKTVAPILTLFVIKDIIQVLTRLVVLLKDEKCKTVFCKRVEEKKDLWNRMVRLWGWTDAPSYEDFFRDRKTQRWFSDFRHLHTKRSQYMEMLEFKYSHILNSDKNSPLKCIFKDKGDSQPGSDRCRSASRSTCSSTCASTSLSDKSRSYTDPNEKVFSAKNMDKTFFDKTSASQKKVNILYKCMDPKTPYVKHIEWGQTL